MLYFVGTPIGNLKDVSYRAIETLSNVDIIACEDTRHSQVFLNHYNIKKPLISYHKFNEKECAQTIIKHLEDGKDLAVISDAGMPIISDPGGVLIQSLIQKGLEWTVIPGACAFVPAMILSGLDCSKFCFIGFLPEKIKDIQKLLENYISVEAPLIFYVAPHDIDTTVKNLYEVFGDRKAVAVREITKIYEERIEFNLSDGYNGEKRGEFVLIVDGAKAQECMDVDPVKQVENYMALGLSKMDAIKKTAKERNMKKNDLYKLFIND